jgi:hypothetical protein
MGNFRGVTNAGLISETDEKNVGLKASPLQRLSKKADEDVFEPEPEKIPPPEPIAPASEVDEDQVRVSRSRQRKRGRQSTILTGDLAPEQKKKTTLG